MERIQHYMIRFTGFFMSFLNYFLAMLIIKTTHMYGFDTRTKTIKVTKFLLSKISFFNKCIVLILITANFEFSDICFNGPYSDINEEWFKTNGKIIVTIMEVQIMIPIVNYIGIVCK